MALKVNKQEGESSQGLVRRFTAAVRQSGILTEVKKKQFYTKKISNQLKKKAALRREDLKKRYEKIKKIGKLKSSITQ